MRSERAQAKAILKSFDYLILDNQELSNRIIGYFQLVQYIRDNKLSDNVIREIIVYMHIGCDYDNMTAYCNYNDGYCLLSHTLFYEKDLYNKVCIEIQDYNYFYGGVEDYCYYVDELEKYLNKKQNKNIKKQKTIINK